MWKSLLVLTLLFHSPSHQTEEGRLEKEIDNVESQSLFPAPPTQKELTSTLDQVSSKN